MHALLARLVASHLADRPHAAQRCLPEPRSGLPRARALWLFSTCVFFLPTCTHAPTRAVPVLAAHAPASGTEDHASRMQTLSIVLRTATASHVAVSRLEAINHVDTNRSIPDVGCKYPMIAPAYRFRMLRASSHCTSFRLRLRPHTHLRESWVHRTSAHARLPRPLHIEITGHRSTSRRRKSLVAFIHYQTRPMV